VTIWLCYGGEIMNFHRVALDQVIRLPQWHTPWGTLWRGSSTPFCLLLGRSLFSMQLIADLETVYTVQTLILLQGITIIQIIQCHPMIIWILHLTWRKWKRFSKQFAISFIYQQALATSTTTNEFLHNITVYINIGRETLDAVQCTT
jgi:hypothetical protein